jgi:hypothetical protein
MARRPLICHDISPYDRTVKLPKIELASVPERKITGYLLDPAHPVGGGKANFFLRFGFSRANWPEMAVALIAHARNNDVIERRLTRYGVRYAVDGPLTAADGTTLNIRSAWFIDYESDAPRFVTAHPLPKV